VIVGFGVVFRVIMLFGEPIHENDFYRYLWDGKSLINGVNPYLYEPAALYMYEQGIEEDYLEPITETTLRGRVWTTDDIERLEVLRQLRDENPTPFYRIGHWQVPTIYPPTAQLMFGASQAMFGDSLVGFRIVLMFFDLASMALILVLLRKLDRNPAWIVFYAWSPLIITEFINSAHLDIMPIAFTLLAIVLAINGRRIPAAAGLVVGILGKYFSGFLFPILIRPNWRGLLIYVISGIAVLLAFAPFLVWQFAGLEVFRGLGVYTERWQNNSGAFLAIDQLVSVLVPAAADTYIYGKLVVAILFLGFIAYLAFTETPDHESMVRKCFCALAMFFFLNPTAFPWYYGWVIPLLCLFPKPSWLVLSLSLQLYYLDFHDEYPIIYESWLGIPVLNWVTWGSFGVIWIAEQFLRPNSDTKSDA
ncbi:MAG: hypothetical protein AAF585_23875, partial [Verrucomicrobiota bacterium]